MESVTKSKKNTQNVEGGSQAPSLDPSLLDNIKDSTDYHISLIFIELYGDNHRYILEDTQWIYWNAEHWQRDVKAQELCNSLHNMLQSLVESRSRIHSDAIDSIIKRLSNQKTFSSITRYLEHCDELTMHSSDLDSHKHLIACDNAVLNTDTGMVHTSSKQIRKCYMLKRMNVRYNKNAVCPLWEEFLRKIFQNDSELIHYLQKAVSLSLSGNVYEEKLFFAVGDGANGKSTFFETLARIFADYHEEIDSNILLHSKNLDQRIILENKARLRGVRFATANELPEKREYDDCVVKQLSSRDQINAKVIYKSANSFEPSHKLWIRANYKPSFNVNDAAMLRRLVLIPFSLQIPVTERIERYEDILLKEKSGILNWIIQGWKNYQKEGLQDCPATRAALDEYRQECDVLAQFIDENCIKMPDIKVILKDFTVKYKDWASENSYPRLNSRSLADKIRRSGYETKRSNGATVIVGLGIKDVVEPS